jgi:DNA primase
MKIQQETIAQIKQIVDPESVLDYLGFHIIRKTPKELRGACKVHGGDNPTAFRFNLESRTWCCYTRHCEGDSDRDLIGLIQKATNQTFLESVKFLADLAGIDLTNQDKLSEEYLKLKQQQEMRKEIKQAQPAAPVTSFFPEEIVEELRQRKSSYFLDRGFPEEILDFYEVGGVTDSRGVHRETIPIRDEEGNLITVSARRTDSDEDPKYLLLKNVPKEVTLYNLHVAKHYVGKDRTLILVEGFVDVWALVLLGVYNVVAAMGTDITPNQARLLWKYAENVVVMLDPDDAGRDAEDRVVKQLEKGAEVRVIQLPEGRDPKYLTYSDIEKYFGGISNHD